MSEPLKLPSLEGNRWVGLSEERLTALLGQIVERRQSLNGLKWEGEIELIDFSQTLKQDRMRQGILQDLFRQFPDDMAALLELIALFGVRLSEATATLETQNQDLTLFDSFNGCAARLFELATSNERFKNFCRTRMGDKETGEVFVVEVRRVLSDEEKAVFWDELRQSKDTES